MRTLVLGGGGMLGHKLVQVLAAESDSDVHACVRTPLPRAWRVPGAQYHAGIDLSGGAAPLGRLLRNVRPDVVVNAIGAIKQRDLTAAIEETFFINTTLPHLIPFLNPVADARVVHFSTDCVFSGTRGGYTEADVPDAADLYGRSKACGEIAYGPHLTIRTSIIGFELRGHLGLLSWFFRQPRGSVLSGYRRAVFSGLPTRTLARTVLHVLRHVPTLRGLYHVASEPITKLELLARVERTFGLGHRLLPDESVVIDRSLDDTRFRAATGLPRPGWDELLAELDHDFRSMPYADVYRTVLSTTTPA